jgi:hypothetical protein
MGGLTNNRHRHQDALSRIDHREFERLIGAFYRGQGWQVEFTGTGSTAQRFDGGVDLVLRRDSEVVLVQCKHWNAKQVPHNPVHELLGIMVNRGATGAILITSGEFTRAAIEAATRNGHVQLVDGNDLRDMLGELPEPAPPPPSTIGESLSRHGARVAKQQSEGLFRKLLDAIAIKLASAIVGLVIVVIGCVVVLWFLSNIGKSVQKSASQSRPAATSQAKPQKPPLQTAYRRPVQSPAKQSARAPVIIQVQQTPEQTEAQRKRAAESLEIIRKTTPEWGERRE